MILIVCSTSASVEISVSVPPWLGVMWCISQYSALVQTRFHRTTTKFETLLVSMVRFIGSMACRTVSDWLSVLSFLVSSRFGFGLMDAGLMTWYASGWKNIPPMATCESARSNPKRVIGPRSNQMFPLDLLECKSNGEPKHEVNYIEQVQAFVTLSTDRRGEVEIYLYSPSNTRTQILPVRPNTLNASVVDDLLPSSLETWTWSKQ